MSQFCLVAYIKNLQYVNTVVWFTNKLKPYELIIKNKSAASEAQMPEWKHFFKLIFFYDLLVWISLKHSPV